MRRAHVLKLLLENKGVNY